MISEAVVQRGRGAGPVVGLAGLNAGHVAVIVLSPARSQFWGDSGKPQKAARQCGGEVAERLSVTLLGGLFVFKESFNERQEMGKCSRYSCFTAMYSRFTSHEANLLLYFKGNFNKSQVTAHISSRKV